MPNINTTKISTYTEVQSNNNNNEVLLFKAKCLISYLLTTANSGVCIYEYDIINKGSLSVWT